MSGARLARDVRETLDTDLASFGRAVREEARTIREAVEDGVFDNPQAIVGMEYEFYGVAADDDATLCRVPRPLLELVGFEKELGLHNAELSTSPQPLNAAGLAAQERELVARIGAAMDASTRSAGIQLVSDGAWTIPPRGETATDYLTACVDRDGVTLATNTSDSARYQAMGNTDYAPQLEIDVPGVSLSTDAVTVESLATSIQPHYQVPSALDLPEYFRYALRVAGPLLALGANSPFLPPALYDDRDPERLLDEAWRENRVHVFEQTLNPTDGEPKVRFPEDLDATVEAVDRIVEDEPVVPAEVDARGRFDDEFAHVRHKHGTYWRWVRPVFGGESRSAANVRVEFRPLPAQPTVRDSVAFQAAFAGLLKSMVDTDHPVQDLDWETARENFYAATHEGIDAEITWITGDGDETENRDELFADLFEHAADGLQRRGLSNDEAATYLRPLRQRADSRVTPAAWKVEQVRERLADGDDFADAVHGMQREYVDQQRETLLDGDFASWPSVSA